MWMLPLYLHVNQKSDDDNDDDDESKGCKWDVKSEYKKTTNRIAVIESQVPTFWNWLRREQLFSLRTDPPSN